MDPQGANAGTTGRGGVRALWPYVREHRRLLGAAAVFSIAAAALSLVQPVLVGRIITAVGDGAPLTGLVWALVGLLAAGAVSSPRSSTTCCNGPQRVWCSPPAPS
jgi:ATP-binding cassette subfamily B protein